MAPNIHLLSCRQLLRVNSSQTSSFLFLSNDRSISSRASTIDRQRLLQDRLLRLLRPGARGSWGCGGLVTSGVCIHGGRERQVGAEVSAHYNPSPTQESEVHDVSSGWPSKSNCSSCRVLPTSSARSFLGPLSRSQGHLETT